MNPSNKLATDVLIIGAGAAGLMAANKLQEAGYKIEILEARNRIGGRIWTDCSHGSPMELGAEFIHGKPQETLALLKTSHLKIVESCCNDLFKNKEDFVSTDFGKMIHELHQQIDPHQKMSYATFLKTAQATPFQKKIARSYVENFHAAEPDFISTEAISAAEQASHKNGEEKNYRVAQGYDALINFLVTSLPTSSIHLQHVVQEISWKPQHVTVTAATPTGEKKYYARQLLITVPLGILQANQGETGAIRFYPELTSKKEALSHLKMGHVLKILIQCKERFWEKQGRFGVLVVPDAEICGWWTQEPEKSNILTGWVGGPFATQAISWETPRLMEHVINSLATAFDKNKRELEPLIENITWHNWSHDPFSRGAYSYPGIKGLQAARSLAEPIEETLFFAGEATDYQGNYGTVHGALASGTRAAKQIMKLTSA